MSKRIESVFGIVFSEDEKEILLIKRRDIPLWVFPGGGVESEESPEDAVVRELKEETGLDVVVTRVVAHYLESRPFLKPTNLYACKIKSGSLNREVNEVRDIQFFSLNELPYDLMPPALSRIYRGCFKVCSDDSKKD